MHGEQLGSGVRIQVPRRSRLVQFDVTDERVHAGHILRIGEERLIRKKLHASARSTLPSRRGRHSGHALGCAAWAPLTKEM